MRPLPPRHWRFLALAAVLSAAFLAVPAFAQPALSEVEGFLLLDRPDPETLFETEPSTAPARDFDEFLKGLEPFSYDQERWDGMRKAYEQGTLREEAPVAAVAPSTAAPPALPAERPPELEVPSYGTSLSVTGRKVIGFNYSSKRFIRPQTTTTRPRSLTLFDIRQELQIRMQGKVGPKVTVNVDYDDTKENKQDISVVYQGDPQEVVQNASFGDIDLSLPATEFVSYNKQLFGIRADLKYKRAKATFIGSRTKGTTKTKRFVGNTQLATANIADTSYLRRQYYDLTFGNPARLPIAPASERVFLDQQNPSSETPNTQSLVADDLGDSSSTYGGRFNLLLPGLDYTVDYANGLLTFKNALLSQAVVAVDFKNANATSLSQNSSTATVDASGTGRIKLVKTSNDLPVSTAAAAGASEVGYRRELKTYYFIGQAPLVRDDGRGNFILRALDFNRAEVGSALNPAQRYPDTIDMDFENGIFHLDAPFGSAGAPAVPDPDVYSPTPLSKRVFYVEYRYRLKTFFLEPSLVVQSETILIDGRRLSRNIDYFVDYDSGFITFFREDQIGSASVIDATYEVAPFGGIGTESLLGTRFSYDITSKWGVGTTLLYQSAGKPPGTPTLSDLPRSLAVYDVDTSLRDLRLLPFLTGSFAAEVARSALNPNLSRYALVENMEGVKQEDATSLDHNFWQIASNPTAAPADPRAVSWISEKVKVLEVFPNAQASASDTQLVLNLDYDFTVPGSTEVSIVYPFSDAGLDFSKKSFLEVVMFGDIGSDAELNLHLGSINEDADGKGGKTLNCADGTQRPNSPKTEDENCDGVLQQAEDGGWLYAPGGKASQSYGASNGRIDTADLNRNGRLEPQDFSGGDFGYAKGGGLFDATSQSTRTTVNFSGWHTFQIPLAITSTDTVRWTAIRQVRLSLRQTPGQTKNQGRVRIARLAVVGNLWQQGTVQGNSGTLTVNAVNNLDNPEYLPIFSAGGDAQNLYQSLYGDQQRQAGVQNFVEQALALTVADLAAGATAFTKRTFTRALDLSSHEEMRFLLYAGPPNAPAIPAGAVFFLRIGNDANYWEAAVPLTAPGWRLYTLKLETLGGSKTSSLLVNGSPYEVRVSSTGAPSLQQIAQVVAGLRNSGPGAINAAVWFNEIHMSKPKVAIGEARKFQGDFDIPGWMSLGGKHRFMDRNFQTPTSVVVNQDNQQDSAYLNFKRIAFFPMAFNVARTITETSNASVTGTNSNLVSLLSEGKVTRWVGSANGTFTYGAWPRLALGYGRDRTEYELLTRLDDKNTYSGQLTYAVPGGLRVLPRSLDLSYTRTDAKVEFQSLAARLVPGNYDTLENTDDYGAKLAFEPWGGATINPSYQRKDTRERRTDFSSGSALMKSYPKLRAQTAGATASLRILSWFTPSVNYTITTNENSNLTISTRAVLGATYFFDIADLKAITRNASGGVTLPLNGVEMFPGFRPVKALTVQGGYQLQDGDSWQDVESGFDSLGILSVRRRLRPKSPVAQLLNSTLRDTYNVNVRWAPLEAYSFPGRWSAFQTLSISNNYTSSLERKDVTGTKTRTVSRTLPDLLGSMGQMEKILRTEDWMTNGQTNLRWSERRTKTLGLSLTDETSVGGDFRFLAFKRLDSSLTYNRRASEAKDLRVGQTTSASRHQDASGQATFDIGPWRFTPKIDWSLDTADTGGRRTQDVTVLTPSLLVRADLSLPRGLRLPLMKDVLVLPNRIIWTTTTSFARRRSALTEADNSNLLNLTTSGDYEIAKNLRMTLNGGLSRLWHKFLKQEDFISYNVGTTLTFQF